MSRQSCFQITLAVASLAVVGQARAGLFDAVVSGSVKWTDNAGGLHDARNIKLQLVSSAGVLSTVSTDINGAYRLTIANNNPFFQPTVQLVAFADNDATFVASTFAAADTYSAATPGVGIAPGNNNIGFNIPDNADSATHAFSVADAMITGQQYAGVVRGAAPAKLPTKFPVAGSFFDPVATTLAIRGTAWFQWDVSDHEYGHYMQQLDRLANNPGGDHFIGASNIAANGSNKNSAIRLGWGEGVANYQGVASQLVANGGGFNRPNFAGVGDNIWAGNASFKVSDNDAVGNGGESGETAVARVLYCLADPGNGSWDRVARGHTQLYADLKAAAGAAPAKLQSLSQFNQYYLTTIAANDTDRVNLGSIEMHFDISPTPAGGAIGTTKSLGDAAPSFNWSLGNNASNDKFQMIFFNSALTQRLLSLTVPGDETIAYTLTPAQWDYLQNFVGDIKFVVIGSDLKDPALADYAADSKTGGYWSDAFKFTLVPEPSSGLLILAPLAVLRRRKA